jgi:hypothetical protein
MGEAGLAAFGEQGEVRKPVDVGAGEAADRQDVGRAVGLGAQAEQPVFRRPRPVQRGVVQPGDEAADEGARLGRPAALDLRGGATEIEDAERMVDLGGERPGDLGEAAAADQAQQGDLRAAQMAVHEAEGEGEIGIARGLDPGDEMRVPADGDRLLQRQAGLRQRGDPLGGAALARQQRGAAGQDGKRRQHQARAAAPSVASCQASPPRPAPPVPRLNADAGPRVEPGCER